MRREVKREHVARVLFKLVVPAIVSIALVVEILQTNGGSAIDLVARWLGITAALLWPVRQALPSLGARSEYLLGLSISIVILGCFAISATGGITLIPAAFGMAGVFSCGSLTLIPAVFASLGAVVAALLGALSRPLAGTHVLVMVLALSIGGLGGYSRRQRELFDEREQQLTQEKLRVHQSEQQRQIFEQRQAIARDLHDVLAHSLGGLVVQLEAVDAQLEAQDVVSARQRVKLAQRLARDGLGEAKHAVAILRAGDAGEYCQPLSWTDAVDRLGQDHRDAGGILIRTVVGHQREMTRQAIVSVMWNIVREGLTNARKHAPGQAVTWSEVWEDNGMVLTLENLLLDPSSATREESEPGFGIIGMRERAATVHGVRVKVDRAALHMFKLVIAVDV